MPLKQTDNPNSGFRESIVVTSYDRVSNNYYRYRTASASLEVLEKEYIKIATSVAKNDIFYVATYGMRQAGVLKKKEVVINNSTNSANMWYDLYKIDKTINASLNLHMIL